MNLVSLGMRALQFVTLGLRGPRVVHGRACVTASTPGAGVLVDVTGAAISVRQSEAAATVFVEVLECQP